MNNVKLEPHNASFIDHVASVLRWVLSAPVYLFFWPTLILGSFILSRRQMNFLLYAFSKSVLWAAGIKCRVHGVEKLDPNAAYLFLFNHINIFDHFVIFSALGGRTIRGVEKEAHFKWPVYGKVLKQIEMISIPPRGNTEKAIQSLGQAQKMLEEGVSMGIAPEGTRSMDGLIQRFKKGAFHVAINTQATIAPTVFVGAFEVNRKKDWHIYPGTVDVYFEETILTKGMDKSDVGRLCDQVEGVIRERFSEGYRLRQSTK